MTNAKWLIVIPPYGAARDVGFEAVRAFTTLYSKDACLSFDCKSYYDFFFNQLKNPEESLVVDLVNHALTVQCLAYQTTHILVCALSPVTLFTLQLLQHQNIKTIHWFYEDYKRATYWKDVLPGYNYFFAIQKGQVEELCQKVGCIFHLLPTAASSIAVDSAQNDHQPPIADVSFVGIPSNYRIEMLEYCASQGITFTIAGLGWKNYKGSLEKFIVNGEWINTTQTTQILRSAKIGLNISVDSPENDRSNTHISPRVFDILAANAILVTENIPLAKEILDDIQYYSYNSKEEACIQIQTALNNVTNEFSTRNINKNKILQKHTYINRVQKICTFCLS